MNHFDKRRSSLHASAPRSAFLLLLAIESLGTSLQLLSQSPTEILPDATPQILQVKPSQAAAGEEITLDIDGRNFSAGAYVSFANPSIRTVSTRRVSATQLEAKLAIAKNAAPGLATLMVSNPASAVAETPFTIVAAAASPTGPASLVLPATPGAVTPDVPAPGTPEVSKVTPPNAGRGGPVTLEITGKNFQPGVKVAFSNPDVRVLSTQFEKSTQIKVSIQIASDSATGPTSMFVVNPGDLEAETQFNVTDARPTATTTTTPGTTVATTTGSEGGNSKETAATGGARGSNASQSFDVYNLGEVTSIFKSTGKSKGALVLSGGKLSYQENGKDVFSTSLKDIQEVDENSIFGVKTGTFHIILGSGKSYNFVAASLRPTDTDAIVNSLRSALQ